MTVLHIANDYLGSTVYKELYEALANNKVDQLVYCPLRKSTKNKSEEQETTSFPYRTIFSPALRKHHRFLFKKKIDFLSEDIVKRVDFEQVQIVHATTLFSDGAIAYRLFADFGIPYIVTIRNTDLNLFLKYMIHLRQLGLSILRNAYKIIFISPVYLERFSKDIYIRKYVKEFEHKMVVIPNGINSFWINNCNPKRNFLTTPAQLLYIGSFSKGKNVVSLIGAVERLIEDNYQYQLHIVGGAGDDSKRVIKLIEEKGFIEYHGQIFEKKRLLQIMRSSDIFAMPSKHETFGLVYIEALSQGLPILYTKGEGIDGLYGKTIGESVDPNSVEDIKNAIQRMTCNYPDYSFDSREITQAHQWSKIAESYSHIYGDAIRHSK